MKKVFAVLLVVSMLCSVFLCPANAESENMTRLTERMRQLAAQAGLPTIDEALYTMNADSGRVEVSDSLEEYDPDNMAEFDFGQFRCVILERHLPEKEFTAYDSGYPDNYIENLPDDFTGEDIGQSRVWLRCDLMNRIPAELRAASLEEADVLIIAESQYFLSGSISVSDFYSSDDELKAYIDEGLAKLTEDEAKDLREKLFARYKNNLILQTAMKESGIDDYNLSESIRNEQEMFDIFYDLLESKVTHSSLGMINESLDLDKASATFKYERPTFSIPIGNAVCTAVKDASGKYFFRRMVGGDKVFVKGDELQGAKDYIKLFRNIFTISQSIGEFAKGIGEDPEQHGYLPFRTLEWLSRVNAAMDNNRPENIEYRAMPKAGSMQAKFKAEALAIAKADDPKVIDIVITSDDWDVLMKGLVPERRNIYGYYITQDELGKICKERVWTQKYQGNGNYGKLKAGGVGVSADFYVK